MAQTSGLTVFLEKIMDIKVTRVAGASAGIFGSSGADNDILHSLKKGAIELAVEYRKISVDQAKLQKLSNDVRGYIETLQLMNTLSEEKAHELTNQLQDLGR